jgi:collagen triple helix repeat protein
MRRITRRRPSPATLLSAIALFVVLTGPSYAAVSKLLPKNSVGSAQVINGSLQTADLSKKAITALKGNRGPQGSQGAAGPPGPAGAAGATGATGAAGAKGDTGAQGIPGTARAYGLVADDGTLTRSKNVTAVTHPANGVYCIALTGIDASQTGLIATPDFNDDDTLFGGDAAQTIVEWRSSGGGCPTGQLTVVTGVRTVSTNASGDVHTVDNAAVDEGFFFVVP